MLRPEFSHLLDTAEREQIVGLIQKLIDTLSSREVAIDERHTPKLYARFLNGLLSRQLPTKEQRGRARKSATGSGSPSAAGGSRPASRPAGSSEMYAPSSGE